jgi:V8-like Glu-specific endopeptidase
MFSPSAPAPKLGPDFSAHAAMHQISMSNAAFGDGCSATAIGPHALLTAAHCDLGTNKVSIDDLKIKNAVIVDKQFDDNDHMILILKDVTFDNFAEISQRELIPGEVLYNWGNPGHAHDVFRIGYVMKNEDYLGADDVKHHGFRLQLPIYPGDSGSAVLDKDGKIVTVCSLGNNSAESEDFVLQFSPEQLKEAAAK